MPHKVPRPHRLTDPIWNMKLIGSRGSMNLLEVDFQVEQEHTFFTESRLARSIVFYDYVSQHYYLDPDSELAMWLTLNGIGVMRKVEVSIA
jgi:hypothetical protein